MKRVKVNVPGSVEEPVEKLSVKVASVFPRWFSSLLRGGPAIEPHLDENTIGVAALVGTTFTGHADDVVGISSENGLLIPGRGSPAA